MERLSHWPEYNRKRLLQILAGDLRAGPAVFDFDFTLIGGDLTERVFQLGLRKGLISRERLSHVAPQLLPNEPIQDLWQYYETLMQNRSYEEDAIFDHLWITRAFAGLKKRELESLVRQALDERGSDSLPFLLPSVQLLGEFLAAQFKVKIVSGSGSFLVKQAVCEFLNPLLEKMSFPTLSLDCVFGLNQEVNESGELTRHLKPPHSSYKGKIHYANSPYFFISDSSTDSPLFEVSQYKLWMQLIIDGESAQDFREFCDESWLTQKVDVNGGLRLL